MIAVMNQKGGVGKTTTALNLAHALALEGRRVLAIDLDPQGNLTASFGITGHQIHGMDRVLLEGRLLAEMAFPVREGVHLIPAGQWLDRFEQERSGAQQAWRLRCALEELEGYDYVMVDCPPAAGMLTMNALLAVEELMIPVASDYLSLQGLARLLRILRQVEKRLQHETRKWFVLTRFQKRRRLAREVREKLESYFPGQVFSTPVRELVALAESPGFGQSIFDYQFRGAGADDYRGLARELMEGRAA